MDAKTSTSIAIFTLLFAIYIAQSSKSVRGFASRFVSNSDSKSAVGVGFLILVYLIYTIPFDLFSYRDLLRFVVYLAMPWACLIMANKKSKLPNFWDLTAILSLWFPVEFGWLPKVELRLSQSFGVQMRALFTINWGLFLFIVVRQIPDIGYTFKIKGREIALAIVSLLIFAIIAIPLAEAIKFIQYSHKDHSPLRVLYTLFGIYFATAIPEEFLFRGLIHNLLQRRFEKLDWRLALLTSSIIFGAAHLNNQNPKRYFLLATIAGFFYGYPYIKTKKITVAAIVHALVDGIWGLYF